MSDRYTHFWQWKLRIEASGREHILDHKHRSKACAELLEILPSWQTYRGVRCEYKDWLPASLNNIADAYNQIRNYSLLDFDKIPRQSLNYIWHELGRVKTLSGNQTPRGRYHIIAVCKPLMFIWGQTPPFDSRNRKNMNLYSYGNSWDFQQWWNAMNGLSKSHLAAKTTVISICKQAAAKMYGYNYVVPYGRFLDIYYF